MFSSNSQSIEKLQSEVLKKSRQVDMLDSTINKLNTELDASKKQITDLKKVGLERKEFDLISPTLITSHLHTAHSHPSHLAGQHSNQVAMQ